MFWSTMLRTTVPPPHSRPRLPLSALAAGGAGRLQQQGTVAQRGNSGSVRGSPALPPGELTGKSHPRMARGTDDFIFFKGDSQFVKLLIT